MKFFRVLMLFFLIILGASFAGCGGGGAELKSHTTTTTLGKELMDLETAYKKGVINQKEYERARKTLLNRK